MLKKTHYHHGNLRAQILQTAFNLLDTQGIDAVGIRKIARLLDVAHSAPANHFKNKQALLSALATESFRDLNTHIAQQHSQQSQNLRPAIHAFSDSIVAFGLKHPNRYQLLWRKEYRHAQSDEIDEAMEGIYSVLTEILKAHATKKQVDIESQAIALWSLIHGYVLLRLDENLSEGYDAVTGVKRQIAIIDVLIDGIV